jgi:hypothetical protein
VKEILRRELALTQFSRRWFPHLSSGDQKKLRIDASQKLLSLLEMSVEHYFERIATTDESWFQYSCYADSMFADSRERVVPRIRQDISGQKTMFTIFFTST